jgi:hypothetical protein
LCISLFPDHKTDPKKPPKNKRNKNATIAASSVYVSICKVSVTLLRFSICLRVPMLARCIEQFAHRFSALSAVQKGVLYFPAAAITSIAMLASGDGSPSTIKVEAGLRKADDFCSIPRLSR